MARAKRRRASERRSPLEQEASLSGAASRPIAGGSQASGAVLGSPLAKRWRLLASIFIVGQLWAILGRPIEFATQGPTGTSPAAAAFYKPIRGYSEFTYLNHGYAFFAPDPGPSHLLRATVERPPEQPVTLLFPDWDRQWPRLLYHRHFMLTEFLHNTFQPPLPPLESAPSELAGDQGLAERWSLDRQRYEAIRESYRQHLQTAWGTEMVRLQRVEHQLVGLPEFLQQGQPLNDPVLYVDLYDDLYDAQPEPVPSWPRFGAPNAAMQPFSGVQP
ncbi:hypothetical protein SH139x_000626 [Planctomycetaceae bacterium SH139]